jgi:hypothetical protein
MCKGGRVEIIACNSFRDKAGRDLQHNLESIFGVGNVDGYAFPVKWGLFGGVSVVILEKERANPDDPAILLEKVPARRRP